MTLLCMQPSDYLIAIFLEGTRSMSARNLFPLRSRNLTFPELLKASQLARRLQPLSHDRQGNFRNIKIAARIEGNSVRRNKLPGRFPGSEISEPRQSSTVLVIDIDAISEILAILVDGHSRPQLSDIADRIARSDRKSVV